MNQIILVGGQNSLRINPLLSPGTYQFKIVAQVINKKLDGKSYDLDILPIELVAPVQTIDYKTNKPNGGTTQSANIVVVDDILLQKLNGFDHNQPIMGTWAVEPSTDKNGVAIYRNTIGNFMGQPKTN
jgi:hypothetical protein